MYRICPVVLGSVVLFDNEGNICVGYDMRMKGAMADDEKAAHDAAERAFNQAVKERDKLPRGDFRTLWKESDMPSKLPEGWIRADQDDGDILIGTPESVAAQQLVHECYEEMQRLDVTYFRLNIWGMQRAREIMSRVGMIHNVGYEQLPPYIECSCDVVRHDSERDDIQCRLCELYENDKTAYFEAQPHYVWAPDDQVGIPRWKLGSNDPWLITSDECRSAVEIWESIAEPMRAQIVSETPWFSDWIDYLSRAIEREGIIQG